ncbi:MAG: lysophospholipid acyltransferase family protein [Trueperaceae bacterium]
MMTILERVVQQDWAFWFGRTCFLIYAKLFLGLRVEGQEKVPRQGGLIVVSNHFSSLDPPVLGVAIPREANYMAKKELFERSPFFRLLILSLRAYPVDREGNATGAIKDSIRRVKERQVAIGIFIQGTRNAGDAEALDGAAFIAQRAGVPIQPAAIWREGRSFRVKFGDPITPQGKSREETSQLTHTLIETIRALLPADKRPGERMKEEEERRKV